MQEGTDLQYTISIRSNPVLGGFGSTTPRICYMLHAVLGAALQRWLGSPGMVSLLPHFREQVHHHLLVQLHTRGL